ncbi:DUF6059 family protein [Kitasatospora sp. NPDC052868]|uniref:DUF6059 family protein n=1 Tax=Kitasatospora sp. NPDC052868 TaxID=3364060 RepID=UPI0037C84493
MYSLLGSCLRFLLRGLIVSGQISGYVPPVLAPSGSGPAPGHPERLCPEVPLSAVELRLRRELRGLGDGPTRPEL